MGCIPHLQWDTSHSLPDELVWDTPHTMDSETLSIRLERLINERGTNPRAVSVGAGLNPTAARDIIEGRSKRPLHTTVAALAKELGVDPDYLACREKALKPNSGNTEQNSKRKTPATLNKLTPEKLDMAYKLATTDERRILMDLADSILARRGKRQKKSSEP
jgi:transcriptional regulator with XRE-family HTH domain